MSILDQSLWPEKYDWQSFPKTIWFEEVFPKIVFWAALWLMNTLHSPLLDVKGRYIPNFSQEGLSCIFVT